MSTRAMLYCQHLAGIGHLVRTAELARSMSADGWEILLVCGGKVPDNFVFAPLVRVEQLEPIQSDPEYKTLSACAEGLSLEYVKEQRVAHLLLLLESFRPDVLVTEMFPFGRKQFAFELMPLLEHARRAEQKPLIVASVRDILVAKKDPETQEKRVLEVVNAFYDLVLVHSDESVQPLRATFSMATAIQPPVIHTGYIIASSPVDESAAAEDANSHLMPCESTDELLIVVSCGSGRLHAAKQLIMAVLRAAPSLARSLRHKFLICAGPLVQHETFQTYQDLADGQANVFLVHDLPFLRRLLGQAALSISLGGYNTVMELLSARAQALVFAAEPNGDNEQKTRIESLAAQGLLREIHAEDLMNGNLAELIREALAFPLRSVHVQLDGARNSAKLLTKHTMRDPLLRSMSCAALEPSVRAVSGTAATTELERHSPCA